MKSQLRPAITVLAMLTIMAGVLYPLAVTGFAQVFFPHQANGSLIAIDNRTYGSELIGQQFDEPKYFWGRPSAAGYNAAASSELLARVGRTLTAGGFGWSDVVDGIVYITGLGFFNGMNAGYRTIFTKDFWPARATVKTGLVGADGLVEIMFVASK